MSDLIQVRRGTSAEWAATNPILAEGEPGYDTTSGGFKIGNGTTGWAALPPAGVTDLEVALDARYVAVPTEWTAVTFTGAWVDFGAGYQACQYRKVGDNVQMRGLAKTGTGAIFTLPAGYRPPALMRFATDSNGLFGYGEISIAGVVTMTAGSSVYFNLHCMFSTVL